MNEYEEYKLALTIWDDDGSYSWDLWANELGHIASSKSEFETSDEAFEDFVNTVDGVYL